MQRICSEQAQLLTSEPPEKFHTTDDLEYTYAPSFAGLV